MAEIAGTSLAPDCQLRPCHAGMAGARRRVGRAGHEVAQVAGIGRAGAIAVMHVFGRQLWRMVPLAALVVIVPSCADPGEPEIEVPGPELGKADTGDAADRTCRVILREVKSLDEGYVDVD